MLKVLSNPFTEFKVDCKRNSVIKAPLLEEVGAQMIAATLLELEACGTADDFAADAFVI